MLFFSPYSRIQTVSLILKGILVIVCLPFQYSKPAHHHFPFKYFWNNRFQLFSSTLVEIMYQRSCVFSLSKTQEQWIFSSGKWTFKKDRSFLVNLRNQMITSRVPISVSHFSFVGFSFPSDRHCDREVKLKFSGWFGSLLVNLSGERLWRWGVSHVPHWIQQISGH